MKMIKLNGHKDILDFIQDHPKLSVDDAHAVLEAYAGEFARVVRFRVKNATAEQHKADTERIERTAKGKMIDWLREHGPEIDADPNYVPPAIFLFG